MANETGLDFSDQIASLENKYQQVCEGWLVDFDTDNMKSSYAVFVMLRYSDYENCWIESKCNIINLIIVSF
jgi:hypothetical protein